MPANIAPAADPTDHALAPPDPHKQHIWKHVAHFPVANLWDFQGTSALTILKRTFHSFTEDNLLSRAAELGYYFLFALFPTLVGASAIVGLVAQRASGLYLQLLNYLSSSSPRTPSRWSSKPSIRPPLHSSGGKVILGIAAAIWSASVGFTAIQDTLNLVYKVKETRPYWKVRGSAMLVTVLLSFIVMAILSCLLLGTYTAHLVRRHMAWQGTALGFAVGIHIVFDVLAFALLILLFAVIYYYAPNVPQKSGTGSPPAEPSPSSAGSSPPSPSASTSTTSTASPSPYGSLGAVIILLTWFYVTGLMLLLGAEINSEIEAAAAECRLKATGAIPEHATA